MSNLRSTLREEAQERYEHAKTVEDWEGNYCWAVSQMITLNQHFHALCRFLFPDKGYLSEDQTKRFLEEYNKIMNESAFRYPSFLDHSSPDPVFDKIVMEDEARIRNDYYEDDWEEEE